MLASRLLTKHLKLLLKSAIPVLKVKNSFLHYKRILDVDSTKQLSIIILCCNLWLKNFNPLLTGEYSIRVRVNSFIEHVPLILLEFNLTLCHAILDLSHCESTISIIVKQIKSSLRVPAELCKLLNYNFEWIHFVNGFLHLSEHCIGIIYEWLWLFLELPFVDE
jgi:hypothetical protein